MYTMHFEPGKMPRGKASWSLSTCHLSNGSFVENPIKRYSIGDRTSDLNKNDDGSLTIYTQPAPHPNESGVYRLLRRELRQGLARTSWVRGYL